MEIPKGPVILEKSSQNKGLWSRLAERITSTWSKERREGEPKLKVKISFSSHSTAEEANSLERDFKECDIYIPEGVGWNASVEQSFNDVSQGTKTPEQFMEQLTKSQFDEHRMAEFNMVYNSKKPIIYIDRPFSHPDRMAEIENKGKYSGERLSAKNFEEVFKASEEYLLEAGRLEAEREKIIVESFPVQIKSFLDNNPEYKSRKELKVLISLGTAHTPVFFAMQSQGINVSREFKELSPILFSIYSEITRTVAFGKSVTNDMIARYIFKGLTHFWFGREVPDSFFRHFSYAEIEDLFSAGINYVDREEFKKRLQVLTREKKVQVPQFLQ